MYYGYVKKYLNPDRRETIIMTKPCITREEAEREFNNVWDGRSNRMFRLSYWGNETGVVSLKDESINIPSGYVGVTIVCQVKLILLWQ